MAHGRLLWAVALLPSLALGRAFCVEGTAASVHDKGVCCPKRCKVCDEVQCLEKKVDCCSGAIYKEKRRCEYPNSTNCIFDRDAVHGGAEAKAKQLATSSQFCAGGRRAAYQPEDSQAFYEVCCPSSSACSPRAIVEAGALCVATANVSCFYRRREFETDDFLEKVTATSRPRTTQVHVVIAGDRVQALGVLASSRSVFQSTRDPSRVTVHAVVDPSSVEIIKEAFACLSRVDHPNKGTFLVYGFRVPLQGGMIRAPTNEHKGNLAAGANFARFYLSEILPKDVRKVVYLDADTVVLKDVATLYDGTLKDDDNNQGTTNTKTTAVAVAAVSRRYKPMCGSFINCRSPEVRLLLRSQKVFDPENELDAFNAGVMVIHLERWRRLELTSKVEFWIRWNSDLPVYKLGSNPPLVLAVRENFQHLDPRWNCQRGHVCWDRGDAGALHWSGANKPWNLDYQRDRVEWLPFLTGVLDNTTVDKCLGEGLPKPGKSNNGAANKTKKLSGGHRHHQTTTTTAAVRTATPDDGPDGETTTIQDPADSFPNAQAQRRKQRPELSEAGRSRLRQVVAEAAAVATEAAEASQKLLATAADLSRLVGNTSTTTSQRPPRDLSFRILETAEASLGRWPPSTAAALASNLTELVRSLGRRNDLLDDGESACDYVLVAVLGNELYLDVSRHGRGKACGLATSPSVAASVDYLAAMLRLGLISSTEDVFFVLCTSPTGPASTNAPVLAHFKLGGHAAQTGVLVPGPSDPTHRSVDPGTTKAESEAATAGEDVVAWTATRFEALRRVSGIRSSGGGPAWSSEGGGDTETTTGVVVVMDEKDWSRRHQRAGWRGRVVEGKNEYRPVSDDSTLCRDVGSWARIEAAALTLAHPGFFDARFTKSLALSEAGTKRCLARATAVGRYARFLRRLISKKNIGTARPTSHLLHQLAKYRYVLLLPETRGCFDTAAASLFGLGAAVLAWETPCVTWYEPATEPGETHLRVNVQTAHDVIKTLIDDERAARYLALGARQLSDRVLCPACVGHYWTAILQRYRHRFLQPETTTTTTTPGEQNSNPGGGGGKQQEGLRELLEAHGAKLVKHTEESPAWMAGELALRRLPPEDETSRR